jgi:hypothetical protein
MRAMFIMMDLEHGTKLEDVQTPIGHAAPSTTQHYDRWRLLSTQSAALMVHYSDAEESRDPTSSGVECAPEGCAVLLTVFDPPGRHLAP